jgi:hypothetical protein
MKEVKKYQLLEQESKEDKKQSYFLFVFTYNDSLL